MYKAILSYAVLLLFAVQTCWASPTGLNNIPTTDVVGDKTLVLQGWMVVGDGAKPRYIGGFKYGILDILEFGLDSKVGSGDAGPVALQTKLKLLKFDFGFSTLVGVEGITFEGNIDKDAIPYFVSTQDLKFLRLHGGYNFQKDNFGVFCGADTTINVFDEDLIMRSDLKQVNGGDDLLISGGVLLTLPYNLVLESWLSIPTENGAKENATVKLNYIIQF